MLAAASASPSNPGRSVVTTEAAAASMGISLATAGHALDTLAAVAPYEDAPSDTADRPSQGGGNDEAWAHITLVQFSAQLFVWEALGGVSVGVG